MLWCTHAFSVSCYLSVFNQAFRRLEHHGFRLRKAKCEFMQPCVDYLGYHVDAQGLHTMSSKLDAIIHAPEPQNVTQLRSFLGLLNYYGKFIPNLATLIHPLNHLLRKDVKWKWTAGCAKAFAEAKQVLTSSKVLVHYDPTLPITLAGDASAYGIGAVISHVMPDGTEHPIAFASPTLSPSERNYAQLEKEALSLVFGIKCFHQYLYGRKFTLVTDHKPLLAILGPKKGIPPLAAARLQRWAVLLSAYTYDIRYKSTVAHSNADGLSRLPLPIDMKEGESQKASLYFVSRMECLPVTVAQMQQATHTDPCLSKVLRFVQRPSTVPEFAKPFSNRRSELSVEEGCVLWGIHVLVPKKLQGRVLDELHSNHLGMSQMKSLARSYVWWPGLDRDIEELAKGYASCQTELRLPNFLLSYRSTPHATTNRSPSSLFLQRELRTRLDLLRPSCADHVTQKQAQHSLHHDSHARTREFSDGQEVWTRNFRHGPKWTPRVVEKRNGPLSYSIRVASGVIWNCHVDHLHRRQATFLKILSQTLHFCGLAFHFISAGE